MTNFEQVKKILVEQLDIDEDVVWRMVDETIKHLERPWSDIETRIKEDGVII